MVDLDRIDFDKVVDCLKSEFGGAEFHILAVDHPLIKLGYNINQIDQIVLVLMDLGILIRTDWVYEEYTIDCMLMDVSAND